MSKKEQPVSLKLAGALVYIILQLYADFAYHDLAVQGLLGSYGP